MACSYDSNTVALREYMTAHDAYNPDYDPDLVVCKMCGRLINIDRAKAAFVHKEGAWVWEYSCPPCYVPDDDE